MSKTAVVSFGKFNVWTQGHSTVVNTLAQEAKRRNGDMRLYLSHDQKPIPYKEKLYWARKSVPRYANNIIDSNVKNIFDIMVDVYNDGYREIVLVVGSDRVKEFSNLIPKYNGVDARHGYYDFDDIKVVVAGQKRSDNATGVAGLSSTKLRQAVSTNDYETFASGVSDQLSDNEKREYFETVKKYMRVQESMSIVEKMRFSREQLLKENLDDQTSLSGYIMHQPYLILTPRTLERALGQGKEILAWHIGDETVINKLKKIEKTRKTISVTTKPSAVMLSGLNTKGGIAYHIRGTRLFSLSGDIMTLRSKEGLRVIRTKHLPDEIQDKLGKVWSEVWLQALRMLQKEFDLSDIPLALSDIKELEEILKRKKFNPQANLSHGMPLSNVLSYLFRPEKARKSDIPIQYEPEDISKLNKMLQFVVKTYIDEMEKVLIQHKNQLQDELQVNSLRNWNERLVNNFTVERVVFIEDVLRMENVMSFSDMIDAKVKAEKTFNTKVIVVKDKSEFMYKFADMVQESSNIPKFGEFLAERVSKTDLNQVEKHLDKLFAKVGIDVEFTRHFLDRVNDERNKKPITTAEIIRIFRKTYKKYGKILPQLGKDAQAVLNDMMTDVNVPFVLKMDKNGGLDLVSKTIMRKKGFMTSNQVFSVESVNPCWDGYEMVGHKNKNGKKVPNCVPINKEEKENKKVEKRQLYKPFRTPDGPKKFSVYVKNEDGNVIKVNFGDPDMSIKRDNPERKKSYRARHGCDGENDKTTANYWSCRSWSDNADWV